MHMGKRQLVYCGTLIAAVTVLAGRSSASQQPAPSAKASTGVVATVSATGCVERWSPMPGDTATRPDGVEFVLTRVDGQTASANAAGSGTAGATPPATRYLLLSQPTLKQAAHVNHRVKIDGTIAPQPTQGASLSDSLANPAARETNLPEGPEPKSYRDNLIDVSHLAMIGRECGERK
jgi:hypothetical protein